MIEVDIIQHFVPVNISRTTNEDIIMSVKSINIEAMFAVVPSSIPSISSKLLAFIRIRLKNLIVGLQFNTNLLCLPL